MSNRLERTIGQQTPLYGTLIAVPGSSGAVTSMWLGALQHNGVSAVVKMASASTIVLDVATGGNTVASVGPLSTDANRCVRFDVTGLSANTSYTCRVRNAIGTNATGAFKTLPTSSGAAASFTVAFAGDANSDSNHVVFDTIRAAAPLQFIHLGDIAYPDITTNNQALYHAMYDGVFASARQAQLYRTIPTAYVWDDHDYANNNSNGSATSHDAACAVYRARVPYYPLADATATAHIGQTWDIGRVRFILTDQRSAASANAATDNSSKTMHGASQKAWLLDLLTNSPGKLIVWICPRHFSSITLAGSDTWAGFSTERDEICGVIAAECPGRVVVLSADVHSMGIDDGSAHTFAGAVLPTFQCAPLDRPLDLTPSEPPGEFSEAWNNVNGSWGTMAVDDDGTDIDVVWTGRDSAGSTLMTYSFTVTP